MGKQASFQGFGDPACGRVAQVVASSTPSSTLIRVERELKAPEIDPRKNAKPMMIHDV